MAVKIHFASLSFGASVDQQTGNLSVFDLIEEVRVPQLPVHMQSLVISLVMEKKEAEVFAGKMIIHLLTPDGKQQSVGSGEMSFPAEQRRMKAIFRFAGFPLNGFGLHRFVLSCLDFSGAKVAEALLDFDVIQYTQVAQGIGSSEKPKLAH